MIFRKAYIICFMCFLCLPLKADKTIDTVGVSPVPKPQKMESQQAPLQPSLPAPDAMVSPSQVWPSTLGGLSGGTLCLVGTTGCSALLNMTSVTMAIGGFSSGNVGCLLGGLCSFLFCALPSQSWSGTCVAAGTLMGAVIGQTSLSTMRVWPLVLGAIPGFGVALVAGALSTVVTLNGIQEVIFAGDGDSTQNHLGLAVLSTMVLGLAGPMTFLGMLGAQLMAAYSFTGFEEPASEQTQLENTHILPEPQGDPSNRSTGVKHVRLLF